MSQITSIYDGTPSGFPIYTNVDSDGGQCDGYSGVWPCVQWIPLPYVGTPYVPPTLVLTPIVEVPTVVPQLPPITVTPEPTYVWCMLLALGLGMFHHWMNRRREH